MTLRRDYLPEGILEDGKCILKTTAVNIRIHGHFYSMYVMKWMYKNLYHLFHNRLPQMTWSETVLVLAQRFWHPLQSWIGSLEKLSEESNESSLPFMLMDMTDP